MLDLFDNLWLIVVIVYPQMSEEVSLLFPQVMGGAEPALYRGSVWYTPIIEEWYYQVEVLKLEVGDQNLDLDCREVIFQTPWFLD